MLHRFRILIATDSIKAIFLVVLALFLYSLSDALIRLLLNGYSVEQTTWIRSVTRIVPLILIMLYRHGSFSPLKTDRPMVHLINSAIGCGRTYAFMYAFSKIPLAEASALSYTSAMFFAILAVFFLNEKLLRVHVIAIILGAIGILIALKPGLVEAYSTPRDVGLGIGMLGAIATLTGAFLAAVNKIIIRKLSFHDDSIAIVIYPNLFLITLFTPFVLISWQHVELYDWFIFAAVGITAAVGQYTFAIALKLTTGLTLAPYDYTYFFWVMIMDFLFNGAIPTSWAMFGAIFIIGANAIILFNEIKQKRNSA